MNEESRHDVHACDHPLAEALLDEIHGRIDETIRPLLEEHLADCATCRERHATLAWIDAQTTRWGAGLFGPHVPAPELLSYLEDPASMPETSRASIREHLQLCGECAIDLQMLSDCRKLDEETAPAIDADTAPVRGTTTVPRRDRWSRLRGWFESPRGSGDALPAPALALAAVVLLLLPVAGGVGYWLRGPATTPVGRSLPAPQRLLLPSERGTAVDNRVVLPERGPLAIEFHVPILADAGVRYDARLLDATTATIWTETGLTSVDAFGTFVLLLDAGRLETGTYRLLVSERSIATDEILQDFDFAFTLAR